MDLRLRTKGLLLAGLAIFWITCGHTSPHVAPGVKLEEAVYPEDSSLQPISAPQAVTFAVEALKRRNVMNIQIHDLDWIAAPFGGVIVTAAGCLQRNDVRYDVFQLGLYDGTDAKYPDYPAGKEFFFVARGISADGRVVFDPPPTGDELDVIGTYEFANPEKMNELAFRGRNKPCR